MKRAFFLGAGASKAAGQPLTYELTAGVAYSLTTTDDKAMHQVVDYLEKVHHITSDQLHAAAGYWKSNYITENNHQPDTPLPELPSIIYILSLLDVFIAEHSVVYDRAGEQPEQVDRRELELIRESIAQCLALAFNEIRIKFNAVPPWLDAFVGALSVTDDVLITTNWDILLDKAIVKSAHQSQINYGTDARIVDTAGKDLKIDSYPKNDRRPLYKLHGSFSWLYCQRCTSLYANPSWFIAKLGFGSSDQDDDDDKCHCGTKLSSVMVTPTFTKSYQNRHLGNVWAAALRSLTEADQWHFVGYSFPGDDLNIRALLIKALKMRSKPPAVFVASRDTPEDKRALLEAGVREILGRETIQFSYIGAEAYLTNISPK